MRSPHDHVRSAAIRALSAMARPEDRPWIDSEMADAADDEIAKNYREVLDDLEGKANHNL